MENKELLRELNNAVLFYRHKKLQRFAQCPLKFITWKLLEIYASLSNRPIKIRTKLFWGGDIKLVFPELTSMMIFKYGFYEEGITRIFLEYLKPNMVLFDIGAHYGYYSLLGSLLVGEYGEVHSFEPSPATYEILRENTIRKKNIKINNMGVSDRNKKIIFNDYGIRYSAFNSLYGPRTNNNIQAKRYFIDCISIDDYVKKETICPDFIKIDAESSENEIVNGMEGTIRKYKPMITLEVGDMDIEGVSDNHALLKKILSYGYNAYEYRDSRILKHELKEEKYKFDNILFIPQA